MNVHVIGGVDTHAATHCAAAIDTSGRLLGVEEFSASDVGYRRLARWLRSHGELDAVGIEGTGAYGAGLARHLRAEQTTVVEVPRPERRPRRRHGKSDPIGCRCTTGCVAPRTTRRVARSTA